jgi:hypothetical protein
MQVIRRGVMALAYHSAATCRPSSVLGLGNNGRMAGPKHAYTLEEPAELATGLGRLHRAISDGDMRADSANG